MTLTHENVHEDPKAERRRKNAAWNRAWRARNPERLRAIQQRFRKRHPERVAAFQKSWRDRHPDHFTKYMKAHRGRVCQYCGVTDTDRLFTGANQCVNCQKRKEHNGLCPVCKTPMFRQRRVRIRRVYCKNCEENKVAAREIKETFTEAQRAIIKRQDATRALLLWDALQVVEDDRMAKDLLAHVVNLSPKSLGRTFDRLVVFATKKLPRGMCRYETGPVDKSSQTNKHVTCKGFLVFEKKRELVAFLEPVVTYFAFKGVGKRRDPKWMRKESM